MKFIRKTAFIIISTMLLITLTASLAHAESNTNETTEKLPLLLDLGAKKCIPCIKMAPILDNLKQEYSGIFNVEFIDVWKSENVQKAKKYGISSIPTQIFFDKDGKEIWRHVGFISQKDILSKWNSLGYDFIKAQKNQTNKVQ